MQTFTHAAPGPLLLALAYRHLPRNSHHKEEGVTREATQLEQQPLGGANSLQCDIAYFM